MVRIQYQVADIVPPKVRITLWDGGENLSGYVPTSTRGYLSPIQWSTKNSGEWKLIGSDKENQETR